MFRFKKSLAGTCLLSLCACSTPLFAAEVRGVSETNTQRDLTADEIDQIKEMLYEKPLKPYSVNFYGLLQANFSFVDTSRNNAPDFSVSHARLGILALENRWSGKLEVEFIGNQPRAPFPSTEKGESPLYLVQSGNNTVNVRQAQINFDFFQHTSAAGGGNKPLVEKKSGESTTATALTDAPQSVSNVYISRFSIGGIRIGGAAATAPDSANTLSGFSRQDGIYLVENMAFGKSSTANLGFGVFNTMIGFNAGTNGNYQGWGFYPTTSPNFLGIFGIDSSTFSKAFVFNGGYTRKFSDTASLNIAGFYAFQNGAAVNTNSNGFATTIRDATHIEASVLFNESKIFGEQALVTGNGIAVYFEDEIGTSQRATSAAPAGFLFPNNDGYNHRFYGISLAGDTQKYFTGFLIDADRFLYAGSVSVVDAKFKHHEYSSDYTVTEIAGSVGYGYKTLEMFIAGNYSISPQKALAYFNFNKPVAEILRKNDEFILYLTAALYF